MGGGIPARLAPGLEDPSSRRGCGDVVLGCVGWAVTLQLGLSSFQCPILAVLILLEMLQLFGYSNPACSLQPPYLTVGQGH